MTGSTVLRATAVLNTLTLPPLVPRKSSTEPTLPIGRLDGFGIERTLPIGQFDGFGIEPTLRIGQLHGFGMLHPSPHGERGTPHSKAAQLRKKTLRPPSAPRAQTRRAPSRQCRDARVCSRTPTAMHDMSTPPPISRSSTVQQRTDCSYWAI